MNKDKPELDVTETLNHSAGLVEKLGKTAISDGKTLEAALTVEGIPFWSVFSPELAHSHIARVLASDPAGEGIIQRVRPLLSRVKHCLRDLILNRRTEQGCASWPPGKTILCLGFTHQMYRDLLKPIIARLLHRDDCNVVVLGDQAWPDAVPSSAARCRYQTIWQHWGPQTAKQADELQRSLGGAEVKSRFDDVLPEAIPNANRHLLSNFRNLFNWFFTVSLPKIAAQAVIARHILGAHRPALVINPDTADSRTRIYVVLCRLMGIPCIDVQFGLTGEEGVEWRFLAADRVAVWGDTSKEALLKQKVSEEKIVVTGSPRHDDLVSPAKAELKAKRAELGVPENSALVVLASTYYLKTHDKYSDPQILRSMQRAVFEAADKTPGIFLVVKPHPVEDARGTRALMGNSPNVAYVEGRADIRELIKVCDAFVSFGSTATIDALIADRLTICPIFPGWVFSDIFKNAGTSLTPGSVGELSEIFARIASGGGSVLKADLEPARQAFLQRYIYRTDGMAAARVEALAVKMAGIGKQL